jgi:hypothetical protein
MLTTGRATDASTTPATEVVGARPRRRLAALLTLAAPAALLVPATAAAATPASAIGQQFVTSLAVSPAMHRTGLVVVFATDGNGKNNLWVSHDSGHSWHQAADRGWNQGRPFIATDARGHDTIFSAGGSGLARSDDGGETWSAVARNALATGTEAPSYPSDGTVVAAGSPGVVVAASGQHNVKGSGGTNQDWSFALSPAYPRAGQHYPALLTGIDNKGMPVVQQCAADLSCTGASALPGSVTFSAPAVLHMSSTYARDGVVFAQSGRGVYKSVDGGVTFTALALPTGGASVAATPMMALDPAYSESGPDRNVYVSEFATFPDPRNPHSGGGVLESSDGGATWHKLGSPSPLDGGSVAVALGSDNRIFAGYIESGQSGSGEGLLCSDDGGSSWKTSCAALGSAANDPGLPAGAGGGATTGSGSGGNGGTAAGGGSGAGSTASASPGGGAAGAQDGSGAASGAGGAIGGFHTISLRQGSGGGAPVVLIVVLVVVAVGGAAAATWAIRRKRAGGEPA